MVIQVPTHLKLVSLRKHSVQSASYWQRNHLRPQHARSRWLKTNWTCTSDAVTKTLLFSTFWHVTGPRYRYISQSPRVSDSLLQNRDERGSHQARHQKQGTPIVSWPMPVVCLDRGVEPQSPTKRSSHSFFRDFIAILDLHFWRHLGPRIFLRKLYYHLSVLVSADTQLPSAFTWHLTNSGMLQEINHDNKMWFTTCLSTPAWNLNC